MSWTSRSWRTKVEPFRIREFCEEDGEGCSTLTIGNLFPADDDGYFDQWVDFKPSQKEIAAQ